MNVDQKFSYEAICKSIQMINERQDKQLDMLQIFQLYMEEFEEKQKALVQGQDDIKNSLLEIDEKLDSVLEKLTKLSNDFSELKNENRELEQKIILMTSKLSKLDESVNDDELEDYYALSQSLYTNWEELDSLTRKFIPISEYLYSKLQKLEEPDFSPVILELCRAIENEFLLKVFKKYTFDLIQRKGKNLSTFLAVDKASKDLQTVTGPFVKAITKASKSNRAEYTLGQMNTILSVTSEAKYTRISLLLQDFTDYLNRNTEARRLLDNGYIKNINDIVDKYRNPSAHPKFMSIEKANECKGVMPDRIDYFIDCVNA